ncbi:sodium:solute symporter [Microbulbifer sp. VAAF005]|uniref:sodium:solute symporter n=1 Tax=Microbulbifer sp. VAAF005 TaxID=3034230 RepID=UPI0024AE1F99|nr:sodium:solute symporter [Microbulbifer sp. VAAF005]WHI47994.1 sodium:solute symporter [Microbulbifer sp. VAAF005]
MNEEVMPVDFGLHPVDATILVVYFVFTIVLGLFLSRRHDTAEDYFLAGRKMVWPLIGLSLFASNISSTTLIGLAGDAYSTGIAVFNYEWMAAVILVFFAVFYLPTILRSRIYTMPEMLERRFNSTARTYFSGLTIFLNIVVDTAGSLYAGALVMKLIFPELPIWTTISILAVIAGIYTICGGLAAVIYTDTIQALLLIFGSILISIFALDRAGGWENVVSQVSAEQLSLIRPIGDSSVPWLGLITGVTLLGFYFWCTNQFMVQRVLSAKDVNHGRWGALFAGLLKLPVLFIMVLPGTMAIVIFPELERADMVYPTLLFELLPVGILGLVLAGFVAALMSQIDSTLNSASTLVTMDFVRKFFPGLNQHQLMRVGQLVTFIFMILAVLWAPQIESFGSLFQYLQKVLSYAVPPVLALFLIGFFWRGANSKGAIATLLLGTLGGVGLFFVNEVFDWTNLHFLYIAPILFVFCSLVLVIASLLYPTEISEEAKSFTWSKSDFDTETVSLKAQPLWKNYRVQSVLLLVVTALVVGSFW